MHVRVWSEAGRGTSGIGRCREEENTRLVAVRSALQAVDEVQAALPDTRHIGDCRVGDQDRDVLQLWQRCIEQRRGFHIDEILILHIDEAFRILNRSSQRQANAPVPHAAHAARWLVGAGYAYGAIAGGGAMWRRAWWNRQWDRLLAPAQVSLAGVDGHMLGMSVPTLNE